MRSLVQSLIFDNDQICIGRGNTPVSGSIILGNATISAEQENSLLIGNTSSITQGPGGANAASAPIVIGQGASAYMGYYSSAINSYPIVIGKSASTAYSGIALGNAAQATGTLSQHPIAIGASASSAGASIGIGTGVVAQNYGIAIGTSASTVNGGIAIGQSASSLASELINMRGVSFLRKSPSGSFATGTAFESYVMSTEIPIDATGTFLLSFPSSNVRPYIQEIGIVATTLTPTVQPTLKLGTNTTQTLFFNAQTTGMTNLYERHVIVPSANVMASDPTSTSFRIEVTTNTGGTGRKIRVYFRCLWLEKQ